MNKQLPNIGQMTRQAPHSCMMLPCRPAGVRQPLLIMLFMLLGCCSASSAGLVYRLTGQVFCKTQPFKDANMTVALGLLSAQRDHESPDTIAWSSSDVHGQYSIDVPRSLWEAGKGPAVPYRVSIANAEVCAKEAVQLWDTYSADPALDDPPPEQFRDPKLIKGQHALYAVPSPLQHLHKVIRVHPMKQPLNQSELTLELPDLQLTDSSAACGVNSSFGTSLLPPSPLYTDLVVCAKGVLAYGLEQGASCTTLNPCGQGETCIDTEGCSTVEWIEQDGVTYAQAQTLSCPQNLQTAKQQCQEQWETCSAVVAVYQDIYRTYLTSACLVRLSGGPSLSPTTSIFILEGCGLGRCAPIVQFEGENTTMSASSAKHLASGLAMQ